MRPYEITFILTTAAAANDEDVNGIIERYGRVIVDAGGQVTNVQKWGRKRLAYEIAKHVEGYYVLLAFDSTADVASELERLSKLDERIIRHLLVRTEEVPAPTAPATPA